VVVFGQHLLERAAADHFAEEVDVSKACRQSEVEATLNRCLVERKRKPRRRAARIRPMWRERERQASDVLWGSPVDEVGILSEARGSMRLRR
jgi:hypothetical protein